jgi:hypothetical protein
VEAETLAQAWSDPVQVLLDRGRLRRFAEAIGESDRRYTDVEHARSLGHPDLPVPLTYLFTLESEEQDTLAFMTSLGVDPLTVLHGEQSFDYARPLHAGQLVEVHHAVLSDVSRSDKGLRIIRRQTVIRADGQVACRLSSTWLARSI